MAVLPSSKDTQERIRFKAPPKEGESPYKFDIDARGVYIAITNKETGFSLIRPIKTLEKMRDSDKFPEPVRDMAREALEYFKIESKKTQTKSEYISDTITKIQGVKVYQDLLTRKFFAIVNGERFFRSRLGDLEKIIKNGGVV